MARPCECLLSRYSKTKHGILIKDLIQTSKQNKYDSFFSLIIRSYKNMGFKHNWKYSIVGNSLCKDVINRKKKHCDCLIVNPLYLFTVYIKKR
eukprot:395578_1